MANLGKILGSISPLAGAITGEGLFGGLRAITPVMMAIDASKKKGPKTPGSSEETGMKRGGKVKKMARGGAVRGDGAAKRGKTKGRFV